MQLSTGLRRELHRMFNAVQPGSTLRRTPPRAAEDESWNLLRAALAFHLDEQGNLEECLEVRGATLCVDLEPGVYHRFSRSSPTTVVTK